MSIVYRAGYKYQLAENYVHYFSERWPGKPEDKINTEYLSVMPFTTYTLLTVKEGYAWDGPSGPTIDTKNFMRGSLVHDALYQLIRLELLDKNIFRVIADRELYNICREDGMGWPRACMVYYGLRALGNPAARRDGENRILIAP